MPGKIWNRIKNMPETQKMFLNLFFVFFCILPLFLHFYLRAVFFVILYFLFDNYFCRWIYFVIFLFNFMARFRTIWHSLHFSSSCNIFCFAKSNQIVSAGLLNGCILVLKNFFKHCPMLLLSIWLQNYAIMPKHFFSNDFFFKCQNDIWT